MDYLEVVLEVILGHFRPVDFRDNRLAFEVHRHVASSYIIGEEYLYNRLMLL